MMQEKQIKKCILCHSEAIVLEQLLETKHLIELYQLQFGFDISSEFSNNKTIEFVKCKNCQLRFFETAYAGSGEFYEELQLNRKVYYNPDREEFTYSKDFIAKDDCVLEIGSGSGFFAEKIESKKYIGLEYNDKAIADAKSKGIELMKSSVEDYAKNSKEQYDVVCSFHVLEHVTSPYEFIKSSVELLKEGGKMIISVPYNASHLTNNVNHVLNLPPHHVSRWDKKTLEKVANIFNLEIVASKNHFVEKTSKKNYLKEQMLTKALNITHPKNKALIEPQKLAKIKRITDALINKLKLFKYTKEENMVGENITYVFKK